MTQPKRLDTLSVEPFSIPVPREAQRRALGSFIPPGLVDVPDAARDVTFIRSSAAVVVVVRAPGTAVAEDVEVSLTTVRSRPRNKANSTKRTSTATARIPSTPPGNDVVVVVVVVPSLRVISVPVVVVVGDCGAAVAAPASVP